MKRLILSMLVVFAIAAAVVGCGSGSTAGPTPTPTLTPTITSTPAPTSTPTSTVTSTPMPTSTPAPTPTPTSSNTELQGTWVGTGADKNVTMTYTFSGHNVTLAFTSISTIPGTTAKSLQESGTFTLDSTANPKTIDLYVVTSTDPSDPAVGQTILCIYQVSGTNLTIARDAGSATRPTSFTADNMANLVKQ